MSSLKRSALWGAVLSLGTVIAWTSLGGAMKPQQSAALARLKVQVVRAEIGAVPVVLEAVGKVMPSASVEVRPQIGGLLKSVAIKDGDRVEAGQPLFAIDAEPLKATLAQMEAQWARDKALADNAVDTETRLKPLMEKQNVSAKEFAAAVNSRISLQASAEASRTQIDQARIALGYANIQAPNSGRAGAVLVKPGNLLTTGGITPLIVINTISPAEIVFAVPQNAFASLRAARAGGTLKVEVHDSRTRKLRGAGELVFIDNTFNDLSGTIAVKARFANEDEALWPGESVAVRVILRVDPAAVSVPEQALQRGQDGPYVYLAVDGKAKLQAVKVARIVDGRAVVEDGLRGGEDVVTSIPANLREGREVDASPAGTGGPAPVATR